MAKNETLIGSAVLTETKIGGYIRLSDDNGNVHNLRVTDNNVSKFKGMMDANNSAYVEVDIQSLKVGEEYVKYDSDGNATTHKAGYDDEGKMYNGLKVGDTITSVLNIVPGNLVSIEDRKANASMQAKAQILISLVDKGFTPEALSGLL